MRKSRERAIELAADELVNEQIAAHELAGTDVPHEETMMFLELVRDWLNDTIEALEETHDVETRDDDEGEDEEGD